MQIVIDIPEDVYIARKYGEISPWVTGTILEAVEQGTPLPKGHGRLIDADALLKNRHEAIPVIHVIEASTILEADMRCAE